MSDLIVRFLIGGFVVSAFAIVGDLLKPKSFAGIFGAAPSVALATIGLTLAQKGAAYASIECRSMIAGAVALGLNAWVVCRLILKWRVEPFPAALSGIAIWFGTAFGLWFAFLR